MKSVLLLILITINIWAATIIKNEPLKIQYQNFFYIHKEKVPILKKNFDKLKFHILLGSNVKMFDMEKYFLHGRIFYSDDIGNGFRNFLFLPDIYNEYIKVDKRLFPDRMRIFKNKINLFILNKKYALIFLNFSNKPSNKIKEINNKLKNIKYLNHWIRKNLGIISENIIYISSLGISYDKVKKLPNNFVPLIKNRNNYTSFNGRKGFFHNENILASSKDISSRILKTKNIKFIKKVKFLPIGIKINNFNWILKNQ